MDTTQKDQLRFNTRIERDMGLIEVSLQEADCLQNRIEICNLLTRHYNKDLNKALIDLTQSQREMEAVEYVKFAYAFSPADVLKNYRIAVIYPEISTYDRFVHNVIASIGFTTEAFTDREKALSWLVDQS